MLTVEYKTNMPCKINLNGFLFSIYKYKSNKIYCCIYYLYREKTKTKTKTTTTTTRIRSYLQNHSSVNIIHLCCFLF